MSDRISIPALRDLARVADEEFPSFEWLLLALVEAVEAAQDEEYNAPLFVNGACEGCGNRSVAHYCRFREAQHDRKRKALARFDFGEQA